MNDWHRTISDYHVLLLIDDDRCPFRDYDYIFCKCILVIIICVNYCGSLHILHVRFHSLNFLPGHSFVRNKIAVFQSKPAAIDCDLCVFLPGYFGSITICISRVIQLVTKTIIQRVRCKFSRGHGVRLHVFSCFNINNTELRSHHNIFIVSMIRRNIGKIIIGHVVLFHNDIKHHCQIMQPLGTGQISIAVNDACFFGIFCHDIFMRY